MPVCFKCHKYFLTIGNMWKHYKIIHQLHANSMFRCGEKNCIRSFSTIKSYRRHWFLVHETQAHRKHNIPLNLEEKIDIPSSSQLSKIHLNYKYVSAISEQVDSNKTTLLYSDSVSVTKKIRDSILQLIGTLYNMPTLSRSNVQLIVDVLQSFLTENLNSLQLCIEEKLRYQCML